jgi:outer membrane scaffolding protein for murein synthesis (MipA/OmpV family)
MKTFWSIPIFLLALLYTFNISAAVDSSSQSPWKISVGIMSLTLPKYQGADKYRGLVVPNIDIKYKKSFFVNAY